MRLQDFLGEIFNLFVYCLRKLQLAAKDDCDLLKELIAVNEFQRIL